MAFSPTLVRLLRLLAARQGGVSREEARQHLWGTPPDWVDQALDRLLEAGVLEERGDRLVPLPKLKPLAEKMELLAARLNQRAQERDRAMDLVRMVIRKR